MTETTYSAVIVTRNRAHALRLTIPLLLAQSRPPMEMVVIDSSDDHAEVAGLVAGMAADAAVPLRCVQSAPGMTHQRNVGLEQVSGDVVLYPDDDSLFFPGAMARVMAVYDRDAEGRIGGVGGAESFVPPPGVLGSTGTYEMSRSDRIKARIARPRYALQNRIADDPLVIRARQMIAEMSLPDWLDEAGAKVVPYNTGFRMSFRRHVIEAVRFEEKLGRYALLEDIDAALGVLGTGHLLVAAEGAGVYHHKSPERRADGYAWGVIQLLNRAYVMARHHRGDPALIRATRAHGRLKIAQYALGLRSGFGRGRLAGALKGYAHQMPILRAAPDEVDAAYLSAREICLKGRSA